MNRKDENIPIILSCLLEVFTKKEDRLHLNGDFAEIYNYTRTENGEIAAVLWLIKQVFKSALIYLSDSIYGGMIMFKNYIKIAFRNIMRFKVYSAINIAGLSIGIACFLAIFLYVRFESSYDNYHDDADRIYRVATRIDDLRMPGNRNEFANISAPAAPAIRESFPQIENAARFYRRSRLITSNSVLFRESNFIYADQELFEIFDIKVLRGNKDDLISRPYTVAITESLADKYYDNENPIGKTIKVNDWSYEISGILKDPPRNTHFEYNMIASMDRDVSAEFFWRSWTLTVFYTYIKVRPDADISSLELAINTELKSKPEQLREKWTYFFQPLKDIHLRSDLLYEYQNPGNLKYLYIFSAIGVFVLFIAAINFINLSTARSTSRAKEVGMRKVIGARRKQLIRQFLGESILVSFLAVNTAFCLVWLSLPLLSSITGIEYSGMDILDYKVISGLIILSVTIGIGAGIYPAFLLSGFRPVMTLKGVYKTSVRGTELRKYLVVFQFALSVLLIISTLIVYYQLNFMKDYELGFSKEQKLILPARFNNNQESVKSEFLKHKNIIDAAASSTVPGRGNSTYGTTLLGGPSRGTVFYQLCIDYDFLMNYDIKIAAGESFKRDKTGDPSKICLINETGVSTLGFSKNEEVLGHSINLGSSNNTLKIIGVVKDFHYRGLQQKISPLAIVMPESEYGALWNITLTINISDLPEILDFVESKWNELNLGPIFSYSFLDDEFDQLYRTEEKVGKIFSTFTALGIFIAFLGLFGLALFTAEQKTKEIGIRKTLGATIMSIIQLMTWEFVNWVSIGILLAFPAAYFAMDLWLRSFAYRIEIGWLPFAASAALAVLLSIITVSFHAVKSAVANPVDSLRYE